MVKVKNNYPRNTPIKWQEIPLANIDNSILKVCRNCADVRHFYNSTACDMRQQFPSPYTNRCNSTLRQSLYHPQKALCYRDYFMRMARGTTCNPEYLQYFFMTPERCNPNDPFEQGAHNRYRIPLTINSRLSAKDRKLLQKDDKGGIITDQPVYSDPNSENVMQLQLPDANCKQSKFPKSWFRNLRALYWTVGGEYYMDPITKQFMPRFKNNMSNTSDFLQNVLNYGFPEKWLNDLYETFLNLDDEAAQEWFSKMREFEDKATPDEKAKCCDGIFCGFCPQPFAQLQSCSTPKKPNLLSTRSSIRPSRSTAIRLNARPSVMPIPYVVKKTVREMSIPEPSVYDLGFFKPFDRDDKSTYFYKHPNENQPLNHEKLGVTMSEPKAEPEPHSKMLRSHVHYNHSS